MKKRFLFILAGTLFSIFSNGQLKSIIGDWKSEKKYQECSTEISIGLDSSFNETSESKELVLLNNYKYYQVGDTLIISEKNKIIRKALVIFLTSQTIRFKSVGIKDCPECGMWHVIFRKI
jgi:hypothetical protein